MINEDASMDVNHFNAEVEQKKVLVREVEYLKLQIKVALLIFSMI